MLPVDFFKQPAPIVAKQLIGQYLIRKYADGTSRKYTITATEAYFGLEDKANHASKKRSARTEVMFQEAGLVYVYLIYGIHWLFNVVTGEKEHPEAVLICGLDNFIGSGRVGKILQIDKSFYGENIFTSKRISFVANKYQSNDNKLIIAKKRVGIDYAGTWKDKLWRFELAQNKPSYLNNI